MERQGSKAEQKISEKRGLQTAPREPVNPADYTPTDKVAPTPAVASGIPDSGVKVEPVAPSTPAVSNEPVDNDVAPTFRKPRSSRAVDTVVDTAKSVVSKVKSAVEPSKAPKISANDLRRLVAEKDSARMRAVARYRGESRLVLSPMIRTILREKGIKGVSAEHIDAVVRELSKVKSIAGYRVDAKGALRVRKLPIADKLAYTFGSVALSGEEWSARQWINHPTLFDLGLTAIAAIDVYNEFTDEDSPLAKAIQNIVSSLQASGDIPVNESVSATVSVEPAIDVKDSSGESV